MKLTLKIELIIDNQNVISTTVEKETSKVDEDYVIELPSSNDNIKTGTIKSVPESLDFVKKEPPIDNKRKIVVSTPFVATKPSRKKYGDFIEKLMELEKNKTITVLRTDEKFNSVNNVIHALRKTGYYYSVKTIKDLNKNPIKKVITFLEYAPEKNI